MAYSKEQKVKAFKKLSEKDQEVIVSPKTADILWALGREHSLSSEEQRILGEEVALILLELEPESNFTQRLIKSLKKDREQITTLTNKIAEKVFTATRPPMSSSLQPTTVLKQQSPKNRVKKHDYLVRGGWKPEHIPDIKSMERPISSSLIKKQVEKRKFDESENGQPKEQKPKPYWPDPYRESLD